MVYILYVPLVHVCMFGVSFIRTIRLKRIIGLCFKRTIGVFLCDPLVYVLYVPLVYVLYVPLVYALYVHWSVFYT